MSQWKTSKTSGGQSTGSTSNQSASGERAQYKRTIIGGVYASKYKEGETYLKITKEFTLKTGMVIDFQNLNEKMENIEKMLASSYITTEKAEGLSKILGYCKQDKEKGRIADVRVVEKV